MEKKLEGLKGIRRSKGYSQEEAAERFGTPLGTYRNWEQGMHTPRETEELLRIADFFGVSIDALFGREVLPKGEKPSQVMQKGEDDQVIIKSVDVPESTSLFINGACTVVIIKEKAAAATTANRSPKGDQTHE